MLSVNLKYIFILAISCTLSISSLAFSARRNINSINQIINVSPQRNVKASNGASLVITGSGRIHYIQTFFYGDVSCSALLGVASIIDNYNGASFTSGETVNFTPSGIYNLAFNQSIDTSQIECMKLFLTGSTTSSSGISCQSFSDMTCSGSSCISSQSKSVNWASTPSPCESKHIYVTNRGNNKVRICDIGNQGALTCSDTATSGLSQPHGIYLNNGYAYVANENATSVSVCDINKDTGALSSCSSTGISGASSPVGNTINQGYLYQASFTGSGIFRCNIAVNDGTLSSCTNIDQGAFWGISISQASNSSSAYAYISDYTNSQIKKCSVSAAGAISSCVTTTQNISGPGGVLAYNGYLYAANFNNSTVAKCTINSSNGTLSSCTTNGSGFNGPNSIAIYNGYAYIANYNNSTVSKCEVGQAGVLSNCSTTGSAFSNPAFIAIY